MVVLLRIVVIIIITAIIGISRATEPVTRIVRGTST